MKKLFLTTTLILLIAITTTAQIAGNAVYNGGSTSSGPGGVDLSLTQYSSSFSNLLEANVMINIKATSYVAIFSLTQHGRTIEEAENAMKARTEIVKNSLQQVGITQQQIFLDPISMVPTYETELTEKKLSKTYNEVPTGFEMKKNVHITFTNHDQINDIISAAARAEIYDLVKVDYSFDGLDMVLENLRQDALRILLSKKSVLEKAGIHTRFRQVGEKYGSAHPIERYAQYYAFKTGIAPSYTIANNKKGVPVQTVQYNYAEKNKTIYYEKVSEKQFDRVINPVVGEPMVQVYFTMKGQFEIYNPETETADKVYNEKVKQIQLRELELNIKGKERDIELKGRMPVAATVKAK